MSLPWSTFNTKNTSFFSAFLFYFRLCFIFWFSSGNSETSNAKQTHRVASFSNCISYFEVHRKFVTRFCNAFLKLSLIISVVRLLWVLLIIKCRKPSYETFKRNTNVWRETLCNWFSLFPFFCCTFLKGHFWKSVANVTRFIFNRPETVTETVTNCFLSLSNARH